MPARGDILLVENDPKILEGNQLLFEMEGYRVFSAATVAEAQEILANHHIDLAIVDVRLSNDYDTYDRSGIELVEKMPAEMAKILLSAFERFEYGFKLPRNVWHFAKQRGSRPLVMEVARIFREMIRLNRGLEVELAAGITYASLVRQIKSFRDCEEGELTAVCDEFDKLLRRLFLRETKIHLSYLRPGYGGAGVVLVRPFYPSMGAFVVVKFGLRDEIVREVDNYREYVEPYIQLNSTELVGDVGVTKQLAGARFRFVGAHRNGAGQRGETDDFATIYASETQPHEVVQEVILDLFEDSCGLWYDGKRAWREGLCPETAVACYKQQLSLETAVAWQELCDAADRLVTNSPLFTRCSAETIRVAWPPQAPQILPDPVWFVETYGEQLPKPVSYCITHGDINGHNVFVDEDSHTWLIDFSRTGWGPALRDVTELESVVKYDLLADSDLSRRLLFEDAALATDWFSRPLHLAPDLQARFPYARARAAIQQIRYAAAQIAETDEMRSYWTGLLFYALKTVSWENTMRHEATHLWSSRQQAYYAAARLCLRLDPFLSE